MASQMQQYSIRLILYLVLYFVFNYSFNIQLVFNIQRFIKYSISINIQLFILRTGHQKSYGGSGEFLRRRNFFSLSNYLYEFFLGRSMNISGLIGLHEFSFISFSLARIFFLYVARLPPDKFSNGLSLIFNSSFAHSIIYSTISTIHSTFNFNFYNIQLFIRLLAVHLFS